eukprot:5868383-Prymnesium_polylepis.1
MSSTLARSRDERRMPSEEGMLPIRLRGSPCRGSSPPHDVGGIPTPAPAGHGAGSTGGSGGSNVR